MMYRFTGGSLPIARSAGLTVLLSLFAAVPALAHARYLRSEPGTGAIVSAPPERVHIWFTQELFRREGENWIHVEDSDGARVEVGETQIDDDDRTHLSVALMPELGPGSYRVSWRSLSAEDGDTDQGEFSFSYDPQAQLTSTPMLVDTPTVPPGPTAELRPSATTLATGPPADAGPTDPPAAQPDAGGCGFGLAPLGVLLLIALPRAQAKRRRG